MRAFSQKLASFRLASDEQRDRPFADGHGNHNAAVRLPRTGRLCKPQHLHLCHDRLGQACRSQRMCERQVDQSASRSETSSRRDWFASEQARQFCACLTKIQHNVCNSFQPTHWLGVMKQTSRS